MGSCLGREGRRRQCGRCWGRRWAAGRHPEPRRGVMGMVLLATSRAAGSWSWATWCWAWPSTSWPVSGTAVGRGRLPCMAGWVRAGWWRPCGSWPASRSRAPGWGGSGMVDGGQQHLGRRRGHGLGWVGVLGGAERDGLLLAGLLRDPALLAASSRRWGDGRRAGARGVGSGGSA
jgi:hypothetical protein